MSENATTVHPLALVEAGAQLGAGVRIGPFCHVGPHAVLGDKVELVSHVTVMGETTIGAGTTVYPQAVLGAPAQDAKHKGGRTRLEIGCDCTIREAVTMNTGSDASTGLTRVGDKGMFLAYCHVAHDCVVGRNVVFANAATLAGHCHVGDFVYIGGLTALHQFVRVGNRAFIGGCSAVLADVIPFGMAAGNRARLRGFNIIGMRRLGMPRAEILRMREAYRMIFDGERPLKDNVAEAALKFGDSPYVSEIIAFMQQGTRRRFTLPASGSGDDDDTEAD